MGFERADERRNFRYAGKRGVAGERTGIERRHQVNKFWRIAPWLTRLMLIPPSAIFALIASRYLFSPVQTGAGIGLVFNTAVAITIVRVGFGGFPLACAIFTLSCLISRARVLTGLGFVAIVMATA